MKKFYVYIHIRCDTDTVFYVGKGKERRSHSRVSRNKYWHNIVNKYGYTVEILDYFDTEQEALNREKALIQSIKAANIPLCNMTDGGDGTSGLVFSEEHKAKLSAVKRGITRVLSEEHKEKIRNAIRSRDQTLDSKQVEKLRISRDNIETKAKMAAAKIGKLGRSTANYKGDTIATNLTTGEVKCLKGSKEIENAGFNPGLVSKCILGKQAHHKNHTFHRNSHE